MSRESRGYSTNSPSAENFARPAGQSEQVDRNRQASAMYAAQDAERTGGSVPAHLQQYLPGGAAYDSSRGRESAMGRIMGGMSDAIGSAFSGSPTGQQAAGPMAGGILGALFGGARPQQMAPARSPRPVARGTEMQPTGLFGRAGDFMQGRRPLIGMGGVINYEGSTAGPSPQMYFGGGDEVAPPAPVAPPVDAGAMPSERPAWWPDYLPWPPAPQSPAAAMPMPTPAMPMSPATPYTTSYSQLQNAISGAANPLMMGIGGMIRRP